jgi:hypothetical protein
MEDAVTHCSGAEKDEDFHPTHDGRRLSRYNSHLRREEVYGGKDGSDGLKRMLKQHSLTCFDDARRNELFEPKRISWFWRKCQCVIDCYFGKGSHHRRLIRGSLRLHRASECGHHGVLQLVDLREGALRCGANLSLGTGDVVVR